MNNGITSPKGFLASGISCGIKSGGKLDLALIFSKEPALAAGCFTTNKVKSDSLLWTQKNINNKIRAIIVNSGNANVGTGSHGVKAVNDIAKNLARNLNIVPTEILIASTGIIGRKLPSEKIIAGVPELIRNMSKANNAVAAEAISTTDKILKETTIATGIKGRGKNSVFIGGMAKGAGMINPNMATMLAFLTTDAVISREALEQSLKEAVADSFNMITVDNDQSTNDMVICLANGLAGNPRIKTGSPDYETFTRSLRAACVSLAKMIAGDGEGSEKLIEVSVQDGWSLKDARRAAKKIAGSNLVKAAIAGNWPNWGRILAALGSARIKFDYNNLEISVCGQKVFEKGAGMNFNEERLRKDLAGKEVKIEVNLRKGKQQAVAWGCDLTEGYVRINKEKE